MFLGVDGGGTKTAFTLIDQKGKVRARYLGPASYHFDVGTKGLADILSSGVKHVVDEANIQAQDLEYAFFGLPGYGEDSRQTPALDALPSLFLLHQRYQCNNDMVCGWAGGTGGTAGIHVVAGTGSIAYGENGNITARCGGWGELFGDEGAAYWIGREILGHFTRMADSRETKTVLYDLLRHKFTLDHDLDICAKILTDWNGERTKIASLATVAYQAAEQGDPVTKAVFRHAAVHLADLVSTLYKRLGFDPSQKVITSYSGGVFKAQKHILEPFKEALEQRCPAIDVTAPVYSPDIGAAIYATILAGAPLSPEALAALKSAS